MGYEAAIEKAWSGLQEAAGGKKVSDQVARGRI